MTRNNQVYIDRAQRIFKCLPCDKQFEAYNGLANHCANAATHGYGKDWCPRCDRLFDTASACTAHIRNSFSHHLCSKCDRDCPDPEALDAHKVQIHNFCIECRSYFADENTLTQHKRSHLPRNIKCRGCYRKFSEFAAMVLHLEAGNCQSQADKDDIDSWMADDDVCDKYKLPSYDDDNYQCPTCEQGFTYLSGLLQHVATKACTQNPKNTFREVSACISNNIPVS